MKWRMLNLMRNREYDDYADDNDDIDNEDDDNGKII